MREKKLKKKEMENDDLAIFISNGKGVSFDKTSKRFHTYEGIVRHQLDEFQGTSA